MGQDCPSVLLYMMHSNNNNNTGYSIVWLARPSHLNARGLSAPAIRWDGLASQTKYSIDLSTRKKPM